MPSPVTARTARTPTARTASATSLALRRRDRPLFRDDDLRATRLGTTISELLCSAGAIGAADGTGMATGTAVAGFAMGTTSVLRGATGLAGEFPWPPSLDVPERK